LEITVKVNGKKRHVDVPPMKRLLDTLREELQLTGTKEGCGEGECGACSVLVDGEVVNSCMVATCQVDGAAVTTIEGLGGRGKKALAALQQSFLECGGAQCGICTPGMIVAASALPRRPSLDEVRVGLAGNLCRCTGYVKIYDSVLEALGGKEERKRVKAAHHSTEKAARKTAKRSRAAKTVAARRAKRAR
jgi:aerobic-type carbon monoxide dehydrogenase small subunit (CoxS/CutS family)